MSDRTFRIKTPPFKGDDVKAWEQELRELFNGIGIDAPIVANGVYGDIDRSYTKSFIYAIGMDPEDVLDHGVTPGVRSLLRNWKQRQSKLEEREMKRRTDWRRRLRLRYDRMRDENQGDVSLFVQKLLQDSWGYHPGVHDGIDLITLPDVPVFAPVRAKIFDVRSGGWWRLGAPSPSVAAKGDGIVQMTILEDLGPFKKGYHIGFGHVEKAVVKEGQVVPAGKMIARSGFANAWHVHLVYNNGTTTKGIGNRNPRAIVEYSKRHG